MGNPFTGYVRPPGSEPNVTQADVDAAIRRAAVSYNVPVDVLRRVNAVETGSTANAAQVVGFNSSGYGGLFGLPKSLLGGVQEQANSAAATLAGAFTATGSWDAAVRRYSGGGYGFDPQGEADTLKRLREFIAIQAAKVGAGKLSPEQAAASTRAAFPDVPLATLRDEWAKEAQSVSDQITKAIDTIPGGQAIDQNLPKVLENADQFRAWIENALAPSNLWRAGFVLLGIVLVFGGARLYFQPSAEAGGRVREVASA